jgi:hypothetical protein
MMLFKKWWFWVFVIMPLLYTVAAVLVQLKGQKQNGQ